MRVVWMVVGLCALSAAPVLPARADTGNPVAAVWRLQRLQFVYLGRTSRYSCEGLQDKIRAMLLDLGARRDLSVTALACADSAPPSRRASAGPTLNVQFSSPALPDAGAKPAQPGDLAAVDARFEAFTITGDAFRNMGIGDCELVEEFARQVLPKLATREVKQDITCVPYQQSGSRYLVRGQVLRALPRGER